MVSMKSPSEKVDVKLPLAAQVSYIDSPNISYEDFDLNARATVNILECCREYNPRAKSVLSSCKMIYGNVERSLVSEDSPTNLLSLYGIHK
jgi:UDP-glucose 4-epimerase